MKNRVIIVPKDKEAEQALEYDQDVKEQLIELTLKELDFYLLFEQGIFDLINKSGDSNIEDYEDDSITKPEKIKKVILALKFSQKSGNADKVTSLVLELIQLFEEALNRETGVYFYF